MDFATVFSKHHANAESLDDYEKCLVDVTTKAQMPFSTNQYL